MVNKPLQSIKFPGLSDTYVVPQIDDTLTKPGQAADALYTGRAFNEVKNDLNALAVGVSLTFTKENASGTSVFVLNNSIYANTDIKITNNSQDTTFTATLIDVDRGIHNLGSVEPGKYRIGNISKRTVEFRALVTEGATINATVAYGEKLVDRMEQCEASTANAESLFLTHGWPDAFEWENKSFLIGGSWSNSSITLSTKSACVAKANAKISCKAGYKFVVRKWSSLTRTSENLIENRGYVASGAVLYVNAGDIFDVSIRKIDDANISTLEGANIQIFVDNENIGSHSYTPVGEMIDVRAQKYNVVEFGGVRSTPAASITPSVTEVQGTAIYGGTIFQLYSNDVLLLIDMTTNEKTQLSITSGHGNTIDFSNEFYDENDEFPLAYITPLTNPATVYVTRITRSATTLIRTLAFPLDKTGYYAGHAVDAKNNVLYQVGYKNNSVSSAANDNHLIVSKWDLSALTNNGDSTYTPGFVSSFDAPFYSTLQGQCFLNGKIVCISSPGRDNVPTRIIFIDPRIQQITSVMNEFPSTIKYVETEGIAFVPEGNKYYMVLKTANVFYYRIDFN